MGYYMGDFYGRRFPGMRRGDPGFFSVLGSLAKSALGFIPGVGPIASRAVEAVSSIAPRVSSPGTISKAVDIGRGVIKQGGAIVKKHPVLTAAGGAGAIAIAAEAHHLLRGHAGRRRKRMNVCNPRALRRAIRRTHGFARLAMKTIHLVHPKKKARFGGFKKRRKR